MGVRVCILTSVHPRDDVRIFLKEAQTLASSGYDVRLVVADGKGAETRGGIHILDVGASRWGRCGRVTTTLWRVFRRARALQADIYHFHDPELLLVGFGLRLCGYPVIYDVHEDLPRQTLNKHYLPAWVRRPLAAVIEVIENMLARRMSGIVAATPIIAARFPPAITTVVQNYPILGELDRPQATTYRDRPAAAVYLGGLARVRGIFEMVQAIGLVNQQLPAKLILGGTFNPREIEEEVRALPGWQAVDYRGWLSREGVAEILSQSRVGLVTLYPTNNHVDGLPTKLFEYIAAGIPVIASDFRRSIVEGSQCGLLVDPFDPHAIAEALLWIFTHAEEAEAMGERGRRAVLESTNWEIESRKLIAQYERILQSHPSNISTTAGHSGPI